MVKIHRHVKFQAIPCMFYLANARKPLQTEGRTDGHAVKRSRLVGWPNGPMYMSNEGISGFGRTDGQPENIMPSAPKGGGIIKKTTDIRNRVWNQSNEFVTYTLLTLWFTRRPTTYRFTGTIGRCHFIYLHDSSPSYNTVTIKGCLRWHLLWLEIAFTRYRSGPETWNERLVLQTTDSSNVIGSMPQALIFLRPSRADFIK